MKQCDTINAIVIESTEVFKTHEILELKIEKILNISDLVLEKADYHIL